MSNPRYEFPALPEWNLDNDPILNNVQVPNTMIIKTPAGKTWTEVASLNIMTFSKRSYLQGAYYHSGYWYLVQAVKRGSVEDTYIRRFRDNGVNTVAAFMDTMVLQGAGHGSMLGVRNSNGKPAIWLVWKSRGRIAKIKYVPGTIKADNRGIEWINNISPVGANVGLFEDWLYVRQPKTIAGIKYENWYLYRINDIETIKGKVKPINQARVIMGGTFQGGAANGVFFTRFTGSTARNKGSWLKGKTRWDKKHYVKFYDWDGGKLVRTVDVSDIGPRIDARGNLEHVTSKEPEGMQYRDGDWYCGFRLGSVNNRRFRIFRLN